MNEIVCKAYANNSKARERQVHYWSQLFGTMPIDTPMTVSEIAQKYYDEQNLQYRGFSVQYITAMLKAMMRIGAVKRMEVAVEPYTIKIGGDYDYKNFCWVNQIDKVIDKKVVFVRLF